MRGRGGDPSRRGRSGCGWLTTLALALLLSLAATAQARPVGAALQVRIAAAANFDGNYRVGEWVPVTVALANDGAAVTGDAVLEGAVSGGSTARYVQRVELPTRSQKVLTLYARVSGSPALSVYFDTGKERADAPPLSLRVARSSQELVGVIADDAAGGDEARRALVSAYGTSRIEAVVFPPDDIPGNTFGLNSFAALIVGDASTGRWSAEQRAALAAWVARGGKLIVGGGSNARKGAEGLGDLPPLRPRDTRAVNGLPGLGGSGPGGAWVLATGDLAPEATASRQQDGVPLVASRPWGRGQVTSFAFDPATAAFTAWSGAGTFWTGLALDAGLPTTLQEPFAQASYSGSSSGQTYRIANVLADLPGLGLPSTLIIGLVLLLFIVVIGPVNYLVLRRLDRRELAWVTIPVLTILFTLAIYGYGATTKGRSTTISSVSIVRIAPDARAAELQAFYGIFTPSRGVRDFSVAGDALFTGFTQSGLGHQDELGRDVRFEQGGGAGVRAASFAQWTQRTVAAQATIDPARVAIRAELRWQGSKLVGTVTNSSNQKIEDALLVYNNAYFNVGDLAAGASASVDWTPSPAGSVGAGSYYNSGLGSVVYSGSTGGSGGVRYGSSRQPGNMGIDGRRAEVLDVLSGSVLAYTSRSSSTYSPYAPPTNTPTTRPTSTPRPTGTVSPTATPPPSGANVGGSSGSGPVQLVFFRPDAPLDLRIAAGDRQATTLIIQELLPTRATAAGPGAPVAAGGGR